MSAIPEFFSILHRNLSGDEALLRLMQAHFEEVGLGAEIYPGDLAEALHTWPFVPRPRPRHMVHLPRHWDVFLEADRQHIDDMARGLSGRVRGLVLHDRGDWPAREGELMAMLGELERRLSGRGDPAMIFLEYAAGLALDDYARLIEAVAPLPHVSACIDTGHVTVFTARAVLRSLLPEVNPDEPETLGRIPHDRLVAVVESAERQARDALAALARRLSRLAKPMHVHLHDGHLFSRWSMFPVSDHAPIGWTPKNASHGHALLGESGVADFLRALGLKGQLGRTSITLEIHPGRGRDRRTLGPYAPLFAHWNDLSHAEMTKAWLDLLRDQHNLVRRLAQQVDSEET
jgi:hypothetical protein